jgi:uridylate kinase
LRKLIRAHTSRYQFILVTGGGHLARTAINALKKEKRSVKEQARAGIRATRVNALFLMQWFGKQTNDTLLLDMKHVQSALLKNNPVVCGALRWAPHATTDTTAAKLASIFKCPLINLSNVPGLYTADPKKQPKAQLIPTLTWKQFLVQANKRVYHPGQHFILDQQAASIIKKHKIPTYLLSGDMHNFHHFLLQKKWKGTTING